MSLDRLLSSADPAPAGRRRRRTGRRPRGRSTTSSSGRHAPSSPHSLTAHARRHGGCRRGDPRRVGVRRRAGGPGAVRRRGGGDAPEAVGGRGSPAGAPADAGRPVLLHVLRVPPGRHDQRRLRPRALRARGEHFAVRYATSSSSGSGRGGSPASASAGLPDARRRDEAGLDRLRPPLDRAPAPPHLQRDRAADAAQCPRRRRCSPSSACRPTPPASRPHWTPVRSVVRATGRRTSSTR